MRLGGESRRLLVLIAGSSFYRRAFCDARNPLYQMRESLHILLTIRIGVILYPRPGCNIGNRILPLAGPN